MSTQAQLPGEQRVSWQRVLPEAFKTMLALEEVSAGLDGTLHELVRLRASGLNGCAYCLDMHAHEATKNGESVQRLVAVVAWHEAKHLFTAREQAALALTDAVTKLGEHGVPDDVWNEAAAQFEERELVQLLRRHRRDQRVESPGRRDAGVHEGARLSTTRTGARVESRAPVRDRGPLASAAESMADETRAAEASAASS